MRDLVDLLAPSAPAASLRVHHAALGMAGRLADLLDELDPPAPPGLRAIALPATERDPATPPDPIDRLAAMAALLPLEVDLLVLAGCGHEHEVLAAALRRLHPYGQPAPTTGLAARLLHLERTGLRHVLETG